MAEELKLIVQDVVCQRMLGFGCNAGKTWQDCFGFSSQHVLHISGKRTSAPLKSRILVLVRCFCNICARCSWPAMDLAAGQAGTRTKLRDLTLRPKTPAKKCIPEAS